jgi:hypothetical protein
VVDEEDLAQQVKAAALFSNTSVVCRECFEAHKAPLNNKTYVHHTTMASMGKGFPLHRAVMIFKKSVDLGMRLAGKLIRDEVLTTHHSDSVLHRSYICAFGKWVNDKRDRDSF